MYVVAENRGNSSVDGSRLQYCLDKSRRYKSPYDSLSKIDAVSTSSPSRFHDRGLGILVSLDLSSETWRTPDRESASLVAVESINSIICRQPCVVLAVFART